MVHTGRRCVGHVATEGFHVTHKAMSTFQRFVRNNEGSATVEFVLALPILLALMAFSIQYGNALAIRNNLDVAARDAARYLARAPLNDSTGASIDSTFINKSQAMVAERVLFTKSTITTFSANSDVDGATVSDLPIIVNGGEVKLDNVAVTTFDTLLS